MEIKIRKPEIYKEVEKYTSIIGASTPAGDGESAYVALSANEYDSPVLNTFWIEATAEIVTLFMRYLKEETLEHCLYEDEAGGVFCIDLQLPQRFDGHLSGSITNGIKLVLANLITAGWMGLKLPERKKEFEDKAREIALDVKMKILNRVSPERKWQAKNSDDYKFNQYEKCTDCDSQG